MELRPNGLAIKPPSHRPNSVDALTTLVRECLDERRPMAPIGGGTKEHYGPRSTDVEPAATISLEELDAIEIDDPGDLVVAAQAGARVRDLQASLAGHGLWLPLDPPYDDATIGGVLAANACGARRLGYGTARDHLIGLEVLGRSGVLTRSGGRVVKNVTGFDLHKLHVGAFGTLGVIVRATFKVRPLPEASAIIAFGCDGLVQAHQLLLDVHRSALRPVALEALEGEAAARLRTACPVIAAGEALALVGVEGSRAVLGRHLRELEGRRAGTNGLAVLEGAQIVNIWQAVNDAGVSRDRVAVRVGVRPHDLSALMNDMRPRQAAHVHVGSGVARLCVEPSSAVGPVIERWHERAAAVGGYAVVESAPRDLEHRDRLPWRGAEQPLVRAIKSAWDPHGLFNPGRVAL